MANPVNISKLNADFQQLAAQIEEFNKIQSTRAQTETPSKQQEIPQAPTYPKVLRQDTVEDILDNPQWRQELAIEFNDSELGAKAKNYTELLFKEFCEKQTGKPSTMLNEIRKNAQEQEKKAKAPSSILLSKNVDEEGKSDSSIK